MKPQILLAIALLAGVACNEINTDPKNVAALSLKDPATPSIVAGDTLRDSLGVAQPLVGTAFNGLNAVLSGIPIRFHSADAGVVVDSVTGVVVGDTANTNPIRLFAQAAGLQTAPDTVYIVPRPDTAYAINPADTLLYSLTDSTVNVSASLQVQISHNASGTLIPVRGYLVSYLITYPSDTTIARLYSLDNSRRSWIDTTASDGTAGRAVRVFPLAFKTVSDSVVVLATARYRNGLVAGAPVKFTVQIQPKQ